MFSVKDIVSVLGLRLGELGTKFVDRRFHCTSIFFLSLGVNHESSYSNYPFCFSVYHPPLAVLSKMQF